MNPPSSKRTSATSHSGRGAGSTGARSPCRSNSEGVGNSASKNSLFSLSTRSVAFTFSSFTAMNFVCRRRALFSPLTASASVAISTYVVTARSFSSVKRTLNGKRLCTPPTASAHALYRAKVTRGRRRVTRVYWYCGDENSSVDSSSVCCYASGPLTSLTPRSRCRCAGSPPAFAPRSRSGFRRGPCR